MNYREKGYPMGCNPTPQPKPVIPVPVDPYFMQPTPAVPTIPLPKQAMPVQPMPHHQMPKKPVPIQPVPIPVKPVPVTADKPALSLYPVDEGFLRGTIFRGIYRPYKNFQPLLVKPTTDKAAMMFDVNKYFFALHEIRLYLDNYPNDLEAIDYYNQFRESYVRAKKAYETKYGALTADSDTLNTSPFNWTTTTWPWDGGM